MQPRFRCPFWPLVIFFFKTIRHFRLIRPAGNSHRWFYEKSILEELYVIADAISVEYNERITHLITVVILKCLPHRRCMYCCVKTFPKKPLISNIKTELSYVIGFEILISSIVWPLITWTNAGSVLMPKVWGIAPTKTITPIIKKIIHTYFS